jgi:TonB family protein
MIMLLVESALRSLALGAFVWLLLIALRVRNPKLERDIWLAVLLAAVAMPWLMQLNIVPTSAAPVLSSWPQLIEVVSAPAAANNTILENALLALYACVTVVLLIRQSIGLVRLWRLRRNAQPLQSDIREAMDVRISSQLQSPANVFSTIVVPKEFNSWSDQQRQAVIAHERAHVRHRDFYAQQLAHLHRSIFWFNPFAWWLVRRLSILNEHISDDAALSVMPERTAYAELLLGFARSTIHDENAVAMARPATLVTRVERILGGEPSPPQLGRRYATFAVLLPIIGFASGFRATAATNDPSTPAPRPRPAAAQATASLSPKSKVVLPKSNPSMPLSHPVYPPPARRLLEQGTVVLKLYVTEKGRVSDAVVEKSSGFVELDNAARYESFRWRVDPGTIDGTPAAMWGKFAVTFKLDKNEA